MASRPLKEQVERELADRFLRRSLVRLGWEEQQLVTKTMRFLERKLLPDVERLLQAELTKLEERLGRGAQSLESVRLETMLERVNDLLDGSYKDLAALTLESATAIVAREANATHAIMRKVFPVDIQLRQPNTAVLRQLMKVRPMSGRLLSGHFDQMSGATKRAIDTQVRLGVSLGESVPKIKARIVREISGTVDGPVAKQVRRQAEAIARTAPHHAASQARIEVAKANPKVVRAWRWDATLDAKTCPWCASRDGREYPQDSGTSPPPIHIQCRCQPAFVVNGEILRAAGFKDLDTSKLRRPSENGPVKYGTRFEEWLGTQPKGWVDSWMGKERADLWRKGAPLDSLVDPRKLNFKPLAEARRVAARRGA